MRNRVCVIGGGQAGLSVAYYVKKYKIPSILLDRHPNAGGSWPTYWHSLRLFSPGKYSLLCDDKNDDNFFTSIYPNKQEIVNYLSAFESRNELSFIRPAKVYKTEKNPSGTFNVFVEHPEGNFNFETEWIINCTGNISSPFIPKWKNHELFKGTQIHSSNYQSPEIFKDKRVLIVGEGNSGVQILAEIAPLCKNYLWVTKHEPSFFRDDVDGRVLFQQAFHYREQYLKSVNAPSFKFSSIIMIPTVLDARNRGYLRNCRMPEPDHFTEHGVQWVDNRIAEDCADGNSSLTRDGSRINYEFDAIIWCTGFSPSLQHLKGIFQGRFERIKDVVNHCQSAIEPNMWFIGYGDWCGHGSGSLTCVSMYANDAVKTIASKL